MGTAGRPRVMRAMTTERPRAFAISIQLLREVLFADGFARAAPRRFDQQRRTYLPTSTTPTLAAARARQQLRIELCGSAARAMTALVVPPVTAGSPGIWPQSCCRR